MRWLNTLLKRKTFRTFFISFMLVFLLPLTLMAAAYTQSFRRAERELEYTNRLALEQFRSGADARLLSITRVAAGLLTDERTLYFAGQKAPLSLLGNSTSFTMLRTLLNEVSGVSVAGNEIALCYITFTISESVFSGGVVSYKDFYDRKLTGLFGSFDAWRAFHESGPNGFFGASPSRGPAVGYARTLRLSGSSAVTIVMILSPNRLILPGTGGGAAIIAPDGGVMAAAGQADGALLDADSYASQYGSALVSTEYGKMRARWVRSADTGCAFQMMSSDAEYTAALNRVRALMALTLAGALVAGAGLCLWFAWRSYQPIRSLRRFASSAVSGEETHDDFRFLHDSFAELRAQKRTVDQHLRSQRGSLRRAALERLLRGRYRSVQEMEEELLALGIGFSTDVFVVAGAFPLLPPGGIDAELLLFAVSNILKELLGEQGFDALDVMVGLNTYVIINIHDTAAEDSAVGVLRGILEDGLSTIERHFECGLSIICSNAAHGFAGVRALFDEVNAAPRRQVVDMLSPRERGDASAPAAYSEERALFIRAMQSGDADALRSRLDSIRGAMAAEPSWRQELHYALLIQACEEAALQARQMPRDAAARVDIMNPWRAADDTPTRLSELARLAETVRTLYEKADESGRGEMLAAKAEAFIASRYEWQELGVAQVAEHLKLGASYVSMLYKRQRGQSLLDAINIARLDKAKSLLRTTSLSAIDIAARVGYASGATFLRAFKKYEGVTPGQFRLEAGEE